MTSAAERLKQIREQRQIQESQTELVRIQNQNLQEQSRRNEAISREERIRQTKPIGKRLIDESGIYRQLQELDNQELSKYRKHTVFVAYAENSVTVTLVWGNNFRIENGEVTLEKRSIFDSNSYGRADYYYMSIGIDYETESLHIIGDGIPSTVWRSNPNIISDQILERYEQSHKNRIMKNDGPHYPQNGGR
jgi:hypothetical protein